MSLLGQFSARIFAGIAYAVLAATGWKKKTVEANLRHVSQGTWGREEPRELYKKMLKNLTRHVGELLFCFDTYKKLPENCAAYPCKRDGWNFEIAEGAAPVIEKMRGGGIFLTAHYGNYEASGAWLCALGVPLKASFIPLKPEWLNRYVYENVRCVRGRPYSINAKTPREFLNLLDGKAEKSRGTCPRESSKSDLQKPAPDEPRRNRQLFCLLADQDSRISSALDGTFLGCPAKINPLPDFLLKHRPDTPVFFCWVEERGNRKILHAVDSIGRDAPSRMTGEKSTLESIVDGAYRSWLEERIRENPALWYGWTHRRFRSKNPEIYQ